MDGFKPAEWDVIESLSPMPELPRDATNRYADNAMAAKLGQQWFYEKRLSGAILFQATPGEGSLGSMGELHKYSCASCHGADTAFIDARSNPAATSLGPNGWLGRNTITMTNSAFYKWSGWQGFIDTFWGHSVLGIEATGANNGDRLRTSHVMWDHYRTEYNELFDPDLDPALDPAAPDAARFPAFGKPKAATAPDGPYEAMTPDDQKTATLVMVNVAKAMGAYIRLLVKNQAPFDSYVEGDVTAISAQAKRGLRLFVGKAGCVKCHKGSFFSDDKFHNLGVPQEGEHVAMMDTGRTNGVLRITTANKIWSSAGPYSDTSPTQSEVNTLVATDADLGAFRTPGLRNVATTPPYMHSGQFKTLRDVVVFYNDGGKETGFMGTKDELMVKLDLTEEEIDDLVAFLETLTGAEMPAELLQDTSKQP